MKLYHLIGNYIYNIHISYTTGHTQNSIYTRKYILDVFCEQEKLSDSFRQASAKIGATIGLRVNEEDGTITPLPPVQIEMPEVHGTMTKSRTT